MSRPTYVYRLHVHVPDEVRWPHQPSDEQINAAIALGLRDSRDELGEWYGLPAWRQMLSGSAARRKAAILTALGCTVSVERSERVCWSGRSE